MFDINLFQKAWSFANFAHRNQKMLYSDVPYICHIGGVVGEVLASLECVDNKSTDANFYVQVAILHDILEDTDVDYLDLLEEFGKPVADGVLALTKSPKYEDRKSQLSNYLLKIKKHPYEVWMVKMCDRIFNLSSIPSKWSARKVKTYKEESILIYEELKCCNDYLAKRLKEKIEIYN